MKIKDWSKFQHYQDGKRKPEWIKLYRSLLDDVNWHEMQGDDAKTLVMLWMLASEHGGTLPPLKVIAFRLRMPEKQIRSILSRLPEWIEPDDSEVLADCYHGASPEEEEEKQETSRKKKENENRAPCGTPLVEAFNLYNLTANKLGLPVAKSLTQDRRRKLGERLKEVGFQGWQEALANLSLLPFCLGNNPRGWRADFDFLLQPKSLQKVIEMAYAGEQRTEKEVAWNNACNDVERIVEDAFGFPRDAPGSGSIRHENTRLICADASRPPDNVVMLNEIVNGKAHEFARTHVQSGNGPVGEDADFQPIGGGGVHRERGAGLSSAEEQLTGTPPIAATGET